MTEEQWLSTKRPNEMFPYLRERLPQIERKLRLFDLACLNQVAPLVTEKIVCRAIALVEVYAEGKGDTSSMDQLRSEVEVEVSRLRSRLTDTDAARRQARRDSWQGNPTARSLWKQEVLNYARASATEAMVRAAQAALNPQPYLVIAETYRREGHPEYARRVLESRVSGVSDCCATVTMHKAKASFLMGLEKHSSSPSDVSGTASAMAQETVIHQRSIQATLLRHIMGNPFRPYQPPPAWPSSVIELAKAAYEQQPVHFALHDALLEAGHAELAEHFKEPSHPKGCWALDVILGKE
jgi:hypothetical protein